VKHDPASIRRPARAVHLGSNPTNSNPSTSSAPNTHQVLRSVQTDASSYQETPYYDLRMQSGCITVSRSTDAACTCSNRSTAHSIIAASNPDMNSKLKTCIALHTSRVWAGAIDFDLADVRVSAVFMIGKDRDLDHECTQTTCEEQASVASTTLPEAHEQIALQHMPLASLSMQDSVALHASARAPCDSTRTSCACTQHSECTCTCNYTSQG
jgi:hypothetical protein